MQKSVVFASSLDSNCLPATRIRKEGNVKMKYFTMIILAVAMVSLGACAHKDTCAAKKTTSTYKK